MSEYSIFETTELGHLMKIFKKAYGISGTVKKIRTLFMIGRTRIHIDQVENLGSFLEFEVALYENEDIHQGKNEATRLMTAFEIKHEDLIDCAYVDLINHAPCVTSFLNNAKNRRLG